MALLMMANTSICQTNLTPTPCFLKSSTPWADSLVNTLTLEQKIAQLFMVAAWSDEKNNSYDVAGMDLLIRKYGIGGICFFQGGPVRQANLTNRFQQESSIPLLIGMDAEWGLGMRLDSTISFPRQMTMGAVQDETLIYQFGSEMARELKRLGVHMSFSPVVDINNNPKNPVISNRSFGENREMVTQYGYQYMRGLQDGGILASAKHFPGHGDTDSDSHHELPVIAYDKTRLDSVELYPYRKLIDAGLGSVMVAHLYIPELDSTPNLASTLSKKIVTDLLQDELGFSGLIITDALNMQGVSKYFEPGELELRALWAGNDILLYSQNVVKAIEKIKLGIETGVISEKTIHDKCLKVLRAKEWAGLSKKSKIETRGLVDDLNLPEAQTMRRKIVESSITVIKNNCNLAPLCHSAEYRVAVVSIGADTNNSFTRTLGRYASFDNIFMEKNPDFKTSIAIHDSLSKYDLVIAAMLNTSNKASKNFGISNEAARILNAVGANTNVVLCVFANPYSFWVLKDMENIEGIVVSYQDDQLTQEVTAEVISGACTADGKLPVSATNRYVSGEGILLNQQTRLRWVSPSYLGLCDDMKSVQPATSEFQHKNEDTGLSESNPQADTRYVEDMMNDKDHAVFTTSNNCFGRIDSIAADGVAREAYPGCRVLIAKDGMVVYDKAFGYLNYDRKNAVNTNTVYDIASITKVASSTLAVMKLVDEGLLDVNQTLGKYLDIPAENPYSQVVIRDMMSHAAGFTAWIPFYVSTLKDGQLDPKYYRNKPEPGFSTMVCENLFILDSYKDSIFAKILETPISSDHSYKYSDIGYYFIQRIIEKIKGTSLDTYVMETFYTPMGLRSIGYNPLLRLDKTSVAPTEDDNTWRNEHVHGYVHDQGAAMMGGVAGHAGIFSSAQDLAAVMQMLLNGGTYAGQRFLSPEVISLFNHRYINNNRRGIGFDKPSLTPGTGSTSREAPGSSFGHTGFTGTMAWVDPENGLVYVFLSNRVNPSAENKKIQEMDIRTKIQSEMYGIFGLKK